VVRAASLRKPERKIRKLDEQHGDRMSSRHQVAGVKRRRKPLVSKGKVPLELDIRVASEAVPPLATSAVGIEVARSPSVPPVAPSGSEAASPSAHTLFGATPPPPERPVVAASVVPPSMPASGFEASGAASSDAASTWSIPRASWPTEPPPSGARTPVPRDMLVPGEQFGVYRIGACIGEGGMARIYQAEHAGLRRQVALKVLLDASTRAPEGRERFLREARIAAAIKHPNVVNIFDVGVHEDTAFLVMELLQGTDLEQEIEARGPLDEATIVDIMVPIVAGLSAVHDAGVVHRDLKPGNVFLAQGPYDDVDPKLLDFGISKAPGAEQLRLTGTGTLIGTPFYMSPEGLRGEEMTPSSDQYSLGVVMYECATGTNPFQATTFPEIFRLIGAGEYPRPSSSRPQISKRLERIIMRAMSLDPAARFRDLRDMGRELLQLAGQRTRITWSLSFGELERPKANGARDSQGAAPPTSPPGDAARRRRLARWAPLPLLAAALLVALWTVFSASPNREGKPLPNTAVSPGMAPSLAALEPAIPLSAGARLASPSVAADGSPEAITTPRSSSRPAHPVRTNTGRPPPSGGAPAPKPEDKQPEWDVPLPSAASGQAKPGAQRAPTGVGANNAPIFD
jgi:eukaryotic-like serine/threonine-protein kinase